jgi:hypothetical protein
MTNNFKLLILSLMVNVPILMAVTFALSREPTQQEIFDRISKYALAYERADDKEEYLTKIYNEVKDVDELELPRELQTFVIKVKVSQFCK